MNIVFLAPSELISYEFNNKVHPQIQIDRIANSISEFGFNQPIAVDEKNIILVGHGRWEAAKKLSLEKIPVLIKDSLTETQKKAYRILDNKLADDADWKIESLELELKQLDEAGFRFEDFGLREFNFGQEIKKEKVNDAEEDNYNQESVGEIKQKNFITLGTLIELNNHLVFGRGDYHWQHEPCWYVVKKGCNHNWQGARDQKTLWEIANNNPFGNKEMEEKFGHGTQKPIECMARPMRNNSATGDIVVDAFLGSGTSIIAAEQLGRACYGMELDPNYCLMIMDRYLKYCKDKNIPCEIKLNGEHYNPSFLRQ